MSRPAGVWVIAAGLWAPGRAWMGALTSALPLGRYLKALSSNAVSFSLPRPNECGKLSFPVQRLGVCRLAVCTEAIIWVAGVEAEQQAVPAGQAHGLLCSFSDSRYAIVSINFGLSCHIIISFYILLLVQSLKDGHI